MSPPVPSPEESPPDANRRGRIVAAVGIFLMLGPVVAFLFTLFKFSSYFTDSLATESEQSEKISDGIHLSTNLLMGGFAAALAGAILVIIAVSALGNREIWVYRNGLFLSVVACLLGGMFGVMFGLPLLILLLMKRNEFLAGRFRPPSW